MRFFGFITPLLQGISVLALAHSPTAPSPSGAAQGGSPDASIEAAVKLAYQREFGETIEHPAIFRSPQTDACAGQITTTAYLRTSSATSTLLSMHLSPDGTTVTETMRSAVMTPAGSFRMLVALLAHPETVGSDALALWERAQRRINQDHAEFAASRKLAEPIVAFSNTNIRVDPSRVREPRNPRAVRAVLRELGVQVDDYRIVATIDLNPETVSGGFSDPFNRSIYMGNYSRWTRPLTAGEWQNVANAVYHHEVAHQWGWPGTHDWVKGCRGVKPGYEPFIAPPTLFGWEDADGDGVPEILSDTPYGRRQPRRQQALD